MTYLNEYIIQDLKTIEQLRSIYPDIVFQPITENIYTIFAPEQAQSQLTKLLTNAEDIQRASLYGLNSEEALQESGILVFHDYPFGDLRGSGVLLGFVDTGIDYTNNSFRFEDGTTRIAKMWDQSLDSGNPPHNYIYGTEFTKEQINEALKTDNPYDIGPSRDEVGHGTFLAGIAGGKDRIGSSNYTGAAPDAEFVVVKLKNPSQSLRDYYFVKDDVPAYSDADVLAGISYLIKTATELNKPIALCIGLGNNAGGHNGTNIIERYLETVTLYTGMVVAIASGNEANAGHHYKGNIETNERKTIEINVAQNENGFTLQIWATAIDKLSVGLRTPIGQIIERVPLTVYKEEQFFFSLQQSRVNVNYIYPQDETGSQLIELRFIAPIPGIWQVDVYGDYVINGEFNMWLPRTGFIEPNTRFSEPSAALTLCVPATAQFTLVVGAYDYVDGSLYAGSGRGPTRDGIIKPDLVAPGINIEAPDVNGGITSMVGTSTSTALTIGACALLLEWAVLKGNLPTINTRITRMILNRGAIRKNGVVYPSTIEGYGKLNLQNALLLI